MTYVTLAAYLRRPIGNLFQLTDRRQGRHESFEGFSTTQQKKRGLPRLFLRLIRINANGRTLRSEKLLR